MPSAKGKRIRRIQDVERELPPRIRKEPFPGDNPLKRPYPPHQRDIDIVDELMSFVPREMPSDFSKRDKRTATRPQGVLFFHALDIQGVKLSKKDFISGAPFCIYVEYECQGVIKCSYPVHTHKCKKIRIDHYAHFSATASEIRSDEANDFVIHVYAFQNPEKHWLVGSQLLHLYNFIREIHGISSVDIQDDLSYYVGRVTFEFSWAYGAFGYGHSNQLRNTKNPVYESICHSMFPRIAPSTDDLIDNKFRVRVPKKLRLVNLYSLLVRVPMKRGGKANTEAKSLVFRRVKYSRGRPIHVALNLDIYQKFMATDFNQSYGEFICLRNRRERLEHLTRMVEGRLRDRFEMDASGLFHPIKDVKTCRFALTTKKPLACPPGYIEHAVNPQKCPPKQSVRLEEGDAELISSMKSAPRFSGYLATVFGYKDQKVEQPVERFEYKVAPYAFLGGGETVFDSMTFCQRLQHYAQMFWYRVWLYCLTIWEFIFPAQSAYRTIELPEISVTLPSPADSTTEFYAHCVQEKVYPKLADLTETKRKAISLVRISRRKTLEEDEEDVSTDEDWETENDGEELETKDEYPYDYPANAKWMTVKRPRDSRPLGHVEKATFGIQHERPERTVMDDWS